MPYGVPQEEFDQSRSVILQAAMNDLLEEHVEYRKFESKPDLIEKFKDEAYEEMHANISRHWLIDLLDYTEDEIMTACDKAIQQALIDGCLAGRQY